MKAATQLEIMGIADAIANGCEGARMQYLWLGRQWIGRWRVLIDQTCTPTSSNRFFLETDHLGAPILEASWPSSGNSAVKSFDADTFGWTWQEVATNFTPLRLPGQSCDVETESKYWDSGTSSYKMARPGLHENHHRFYDPYTGSYLTGDPVRHMPDLAFGYAENDPVNRSDRTGLGCEEECDASYCSSGSDCVCSGAGRGTPSGDSGCGVCSCDAPWGVICATCSGPECGDGKCSEWESCDKCPADCGYCGPPACGDGVCQPKELLFCPWDCSSKDCLACGSRYTSCLAECRKSEWCASISYHDRFSACQFCRLECAQDLCDCRTNYGCPWANNACEAANDEYWEIWAVGGGDPSVISLAATVSFEGH